MNWLDGETSAGCFYIDSSEVNLLSIYTLDVSSDDQIIIVIVCRQRLALHLEQVQLLYLLVRFRAIFG